MLKGKFVAHDKRHEKTQMQCGQYMHVIYANHDNTTLFSFPDVYKSPVTLLID
jgi:hypothetical protein